LLGSGKLPTGSHGFVLLPRHWVAERSFDWIARFRHLVRDYERLTDTLVAFHSIAFAMFNTFIVQSTQQALVTSGGCNGNSDVLGRQLCG
jgi:hypothetical protein